MEILIKTIFKYVFSLLIYYFRIDILFYRFKKDHRALILTYHSVQKSNVVPDKIKLCITPKRFEKHIRYLSKRFTIIPVSTLLECLKKNKKPPPNSVAITFDDGYFDNYRNAFPVLKKYNSSALIFLISDLISTDKLPWHLEFYQVLNSTHLKKLSFTVPDDVYSSMNGSYPNSAFKFSLKTKQQKERAIVNIRSFLKKLPENKRKKILRLINNKLKNESFTENTAPFKMLSWENIHEMQRHGIEFGAHSKTHRNLFILSGESLMTELKGSKKDLEKNLKTPVEIFAFPGYPNPEKTPETYKFLKKAGYKACMCIDNGYYGMNDRNTEPFDINRIEMVGPTFLLAGELFYQRYLKKHP